MYLHIGNGKNIRKNAIIGIFDLDTATISKESKKFIYVYSLILSLFSFVLAFVYLCLTNVLLKTQISRLLNVPFVFKIDILSTISMFLFSLIVSCVCSFFFTRKIGKIHPLSTFRV